MNKVHTATAILKYWEEHPEVDSPVLRAAKSDDDGTLIEVFTLNLFSGPSGAEPAPYWFVFQNGILRQWGRPNDWPNVAAKYNINFNPNPTNRPPQEPETPAMSGTLKHPTMNLPEDWLLVR